MLTYVFCKNFSLKKLLKLYKSILTPKSYNVLFYDCRLYTLGFASRGGKGRGSRVGRNSKLLPLSDLDVQHEKDDTHDDADAANDEVRDAQERILASQPRSCRDDKRLSPAKHRHREGCKS